MFNFHVHHELSFQCSGTMNWNVNRSKKMDTQHYWETNFVMQESLAFLLSERGFDKLINLNFSYLSTSAAELPALWKLSISKLGRDISLNSLIYSNMITFYLEEIETKREPGILGAPKMLVSQEGVWGSKMPCVPMLTGWMLVRGTSIVRGTFIFCGFVIRESPKAQDGKGFLCLSL